MLEKRSWEEPDGAIHSQEESAVRPEDLGMGKLFESVRDAVIVAEAKTQRIVLWNPAATKIFGYSPSEALDGLRVEALAPEHLKGRRRAGMVRYGETGHGPLIDSNAPVELPAVRKDGKEIGVELSLSPISYVHASSNGNRFVLAIIRDVTRRKKAEEESRRAYEELDVRVQERTAELQTEILGRRKVEEKLRESEDRLRLAVETTGLGTWDFNLLTGDLKWDERCKAMFGLPPEAQVDYEVFLKGLHPDYWELTDQVVQRALDPAGEGEFDMEYRTVGIEDGVERWVASRGQVFFDEAGRAVRFIGTVLDITRRKEFEEEELRRSENSLLATQRIAHLANWEYAPHEDKVWWSDELYRIFGFAPQEFTPTYEEFFGLILHPNNREDVREQIREALRGEKGSNEIDHRVVRPDGETRSVRTRYEVVRDVSGKQVKMIGTIQDITEQKRAEEELAELVEELRRSNVELEQFAYVVSHDLQEPLRMVSSYTQLLARRYEGKLDADADEFIGYAVDGANRMRRLINDLLQYSRLGTRGKPLAPVDTQAVFELVCANLWVAIEESGAEVSSGPLPTAVGDDTQLVQLLQNLIGNALKFRGEGPPKVRVEAERQNGDWLFSVRDNGIGIDPERLELEITESLLMDDIQASSRALGELKKTVGAVRVSIDDFGTGYSSLYYYLKSFPIDVLKIAQPFVRDIATDPDDAAITTAIIGLAHNLRLKVIAEGVETEEQLAYLLERGCDEAQGYYLGRPLPADDFAELLKGRFAPGSREEEIESRLPIRDSRDSPNVH